MSDDVQTPPPTPTQVDLYISPQIARLGTLAELTQGGVTGPSDGVDGAAGDEGSLF